MLSSAFSTRQRFETLAKGKGGGGLPLPAASGALMKKDKAEKKKEKKKKMKKTLTAKRTTRGRQKKKEEESPVEGVKNGWILDDFLATRTDRGVVVRFGRDWSGVTGVRPTD